MIAFPAFGFHAQVALREALRLIRLGVLRIDDDGRIWRDKTMSHGTWRSMMPRRAEHERKGYLRLALQCADGKVRAVAAHHVVWVNAHGPIPEGMQINHCDLDKQHNALSNLELATGVQNIRHSYANGRNKPWSRYSPEWRPGRLRIGTRTRRAIRQMRSGGAPLKAIAARFEISISHAHRISTAISGGGR